MGDIKNFLGEAHSERLKKLLKMSREAPLAGLDNKTAAELYRLMQAEKLIRELISYAREKRLIDEEILKENEKNLILTEKKLENIQLNKELNDEAKEQMIKKLF